MLKRAHSRQDVHAEASLPSTRVIPLHMFLMEAQAATDSTDACCEYLVAHLVRMIGPGGSIAGCMHVLQTYLKIEILNYDNLRTHPDLGPGQREQLRDDTSSWGRANGGGEGVLHERRVSVCINARARS